MASKTWEKLGCFLLFFGLVGLLILPTKIAVAQSSTALEYQVKVAFVYNFLGFIDIPTREQRPDQKKVNICILGNGELEPAFNKLVGKSSRQRSIEVSYLEQDSELSFCHVLFIPKTLTSQVSSIISHIRGKGILTIGEIEGLCEQGGVINLFLSDKKLRFTVNLKVAEEEGIKIKAKMLKRARLCDS